MAQVTTGSSALAVAGLASTQSGWRAVLLPIFYGALLSVVFAPVPMIASRFLDLRDVDILYLLPVVAAATRWGLLPALAAVVCGVLHSAYFLYSPVFSFGIADPQDLLNVALFVVVASLTSHLGAEARAHAAAARQSSSELANLYAFSRKLAVAKEPPEIFAAIQEHSSRLVGTDVTFVDVAALEAGGQRLADTPELDARLRRAALDLVAAPERRAVTVVTDTAGGRHWLVRRLSRATDAPGVAIVDLGRAGEAELPALRQHVDAVLDDAVETLERLDVATALAEARSRREAAALREAVIGSASHGLRTPLAAIIGSASILADARTVRDDERLATLAGIVVAEAGRLDGDIQKMLDAATLTGQGVKPSLGWVEPLDLVNAAVEAEARDLAEHSVEVDCPGNLPLARADPVLVVQALALVIDNAARYSPKGSRIRVSARAVAADVVLSVEDEGRGIYEAERSLVLEKFYRGTRTRETTRGSGLGLWIAQAFVTACRGRLAISGRDAAPGTRVTIALPAASAEEMNRIGDSDE